MESVSGCYKYAPSPGVQIRQEAGEQKESNSHQNISHTHRKVNTMCKYELDFISPGGGTWTMRFPSKHQPTHAVTVGEVKKKALKRCPYREHLGDIQLTVEGRPLDDDSASLSDYGIKTKAVVQIVKKVDGG